MGRELPLPSAGLSHILPRHALLHHSLRVQAAAEPGVHTAGGKVGAKRLEVILTSQLHAKEALISMLSAKSNVAKVRFLPWKSHF